MLALLKIRIKMDTLCVIMDTYLRYRRNRHLLCQKMKHNVSSIYKMHNSVNVLLYDTYLFQSKFQNLVVRRHKLVSKISFIATQISFKNKFYIDKN